MVTHVEDAKKHGLKIESTLDPRLQAVAIPVAGWLGDRFGAREVDVGSELAGVPLMILST